MRHPLLVLSLLVLPCLSQAQWEQLPGPYGGSVNAFVEIAGSHGGRIYASTLNGVYLTTNEGRFWSKAGLQGKNVFYLTQVEFDSVHEVLFAVTDNFWADPYYPNTLYRSEDSGNSWTNISFSNEYTTALFHDANVLFVQIQDTESIRRSRDLGATWEQLPTLPIGVETAIAEQGSVVAISGGFVYRIPDTGNVWTMLGKAPSGGGHVLLTAGSQLWLISDKIYRSSDLGTTWRLVSAAPYGSGYSLAANDSILILSGLWRSSDTGHTWTKINGTGGFPIVSNGTPYRLSGAISVAFINGAFFAGPSEGPMVSEDGFNWEYRSDGLTAPDIYDVASSEGALLAATDRGIFRSTDHGESWIAPDDSSGLRDSLVQQFFVVDSTVYACNSWDAPSRSLWRRDTTHWTKLLDSAVNSLTALGKYLFVASSQGGILESTNTGKTWTLANSGLPTLGSLDPVRANAVFRCGTRLIAAVDTGSDMFDSIYTALYLSDDSAQHWALIPGSAPYSELFSEVTLDSTIFIALGQVSRSTDCGNSWSVLSDLPNTEQLSQIGQNIFLTSTNPSSSAISLFVTSDGSTKSLGSPDSTTSVQCLTSDDYYVYAGTYRRGLWRMPLSQVLSVVPQSGLVLPQINLHIYPNPLSTKSWVAFSLPSRSRVSLRLYDELGILRSAIFEGEMDAGPHEIPFAGQGLADGIYSVVLSADGNRHLGRLLIAR